MELKERIIKALGYCVIGDCYPCQYRETVKCRDNMCGDTLSLIKELTEENERFSQSLANTKLILANWRADTVLKMQEQIQERCIKGGIYPAFVANIVAQVAKEMLEGKDGTS